MSYTLTTSEGEVSLTGFTASDGGLSFRPPGDSPHDPKVDELNEIVARVEREKQLAVETAREVASINRRVEAHELHAGDGLKQASALEEKLRTDRKKIRPGAFTVCVVDEQGNWREDPDPSIKATDIGIHAEDQEVSEERADFAVEIARAITVVKRVLKTDKGSPKSIFESWMSDSKDDRRSNYIRALKGICHVGLEHKDPSQLKLARKSLESFREEFVANEAGIVKNQYLWRLGWNCLVMSAIATVAYVFARWLNDQNNTIYVFRNLFLLVAGAGVGTWLSFLLRRVIVTFLDLATLEEDRLDPFIRVLFVTALTSVVGLLLWSGAVSLNIGAFKSLDFTSSGSRALLIGLLLGIAERTMATGVQKTAIGFGAGIGGK